MFFTARQLQDLHRAGGLVTLPYRAQLTPLAADWVRSNRIIISYANAEAKGTQSQSTEAGSRSAGYLWWCDGPCGSAKAALISLEKELSLAPLPLPPDGKQLVAAIKQLSAQVQQKQAAGGILLVQSGASAVVYANRCPSLRAILGTCLGTVDEGVKILAANILVIEHPWQTLMQTKNLVSRFVRARRELSEEVKRQLAELATCG
jgi:ribose 5-phosphate isomerase RpiB